MRKPAQGTYLKVFYSIVLFAILIIMLGGCEDFVPGGAVFTSTLPPSRPSLTSVTASRPPGTGIINVSALPPEGRTTLRLIKDGGPFLYSRDGVVFNNYEKLLPSKPSGYYHEYTVPTPGETDRGARRIVAGAGGEYYYTQDHYGSFELIVE